MNFDSFKGLITNASILLTMVVILDSTGLIGGPRKLIRTLLLGVWVSVLGIILMLNPWRFSNGIVFDTRSVLLSLAGLYFGLVPAIIGAVSLSVTRFFMGGSGATTGIMVIFASTLIGLLWRFAGKSDRGMQKIPSVILMSLAVHSVMLLLMLTLPDGQAAEVLQSISLPVMVIYPLLTALITKLMNNRIKNHILREELSSSLKEKAALLQELKHRTKNTLQIIRSILSLHGSDSQSKPVNHETFMNIDRRLISIGLLHNKLDGNQEEGMLHMQDFLQDLIVQLQESLSRDFGFLNFELEMMDFMADARTATTCGMVITELCINSFKYAFDESVKEGLIHIEIQCPGQNLILQYSDNGIGLPPKFNARLHGGLGMQTIEAMVCQSLGGSVHYSAGPGFHASIEFPLNTHDHEQTMTRIRSLQA